jgi:hypothetical protein
MPNFFVPIYWEESDIVEIEAATLDEAKKKALGLGRTVTGSYVDDSFVVDHEYAEELNNPTNPA